MLVLLVLLALVLVLVLLLRELLQELLREANTMGSKANDAGITQAVIAMKSELDKLREQVENLE